CPCKYGRCVWKGIRKECVCDPEFGKVSDSECRYCDCGRGFNCTFSGPYDRYRMKSNCICTEGYYNSGYSCRAVCNSTHPCQNGGTCQNERCKCMDGTMGDFCEHIFWCSYECRPRLIVDCVYDQENKNYACLCKNRSLLFDYEEYVCKPCPCGEGTCKYDRYAFRRMSCDCNEGYKEFKKHCKKCDCGPNSSCEIDQKTGKRICKCEDGFLDREGRCIACNCGLDKVNCDLVNNTKHCKCPVGYEDVHGSCEDINECLTNNTCHPTAKCINTVGSYDCKCEKGYRKHEREDACEDINECDEDPDLCQTSNRVKCVNLPGTYKCECLRGFEPVDMNVNPQKTKCEKYEESWLPVGIAVGTAVLLIIISLALLKYMDYRAAR
ncbi:uncharacterized protein TNCT_418101, partial [Trichonephila clavata]